MTATSAIAQRITGWSLDDFMRLATQHHSTKLPAPPAQRSVALYYSLPDVALQNCQRQSLVSWLVQSKRVHLNSYRHSSEAMAAVATPEVPIASLVEQLSPEDAEDINCCRRQE